MSLYTCILTAARQHGLSLFALKRVESALRTLEREMGPMSTGQLVGDLKFAQKITLPDDDATYVVIGEWSDGTMDIVREQGSFPKDCLVGWTPGQSLRSFRTELAAEPLPEIVPDAKREVRPLRGPGSRTR